MFVLDDPGVRNFFVTIVDGSAILKRPVSYLVSKAKRSIRQPPIGVVEILIQLTGIEQMRETLGVP